MRLNRSVLSHFSRLTGLVLAILIANSGNAQQRVADSLVVGIGRDQAKLLNLTKNGVNKKSFGIKVIRSRIDILNEIKQSDATVEMTDLDEGTRVSVNLPLELKF